jgi:predicted amidophosphoribosyltransferase
MMLDLVVESWATWLFIGGCALLVGTFIAYQILNPSRELEKRKCPNCGRSISRIADFCPDCGKPWPFGMT